MKFPICLLLSLGLATSSNAEINLSIQESMTGVTFSYSGTWDVAQADVIEALALKRTEVLVDSFGFSFQANGKNEGFFSLELLVEEVAPTSGQAPSFNFPGVDIDVSGSVLSGASAEDAFGLDIYENGDVSLYGSGDGWSANESISGSSFFVGQSLATLGLSVESGNFIAGGQTVNWSVELNVGVTAVLADTIDQSGGAGDVLVVDGDTMVIGALEDASSQGAAYVYVLNQGAWAFEQKLTASDGAADDEFGSALAISGDRIVVGANGDDDGGSSAGSVYTFSRSGDGWTEVDKLTAFDAIGSDGFGDSVALVGDVLIVGAPTDSDTAADSGVVFTYAWSGTDWAFDEKIIPVNNAQSDHFGSALVYDGTTLVIGAYSGNARTGAVYIYEDVAGTWREQQELIAPNGDQFEWFGDALALNGNKLFVGAPFESSVDLGSNHGAVYYFEKDEGVWSLCRRLLPELVSSGDQFGASISVNDDYLLIGATGDDIIGSFCGAVYVCSYGHSYPGYLVRRKMFPATTAADDSVGSAVALSGSTGLIGAKGASTVSVYDLTTIFYDTDSDGVSDAWEIANGFNINVANDHLTTDTDGDGSLDIREIFHGSDKNDSGDLDTNTQVRADGSNERVTVGVTNDPAQNQVFGHPQWSADLVNWYDLGKSAKGISVTHNPNRIPLGDVFYDFYSVSISSGPDDALFFRFGYLPKE